MCVFAQVFLKEKTERDLDNKRAVCLTDQIVIMQKTVRMPLLTLSYTWQKYFIGTFLSNTKSIYKDSKGNKIITELFQDCLE